MTAGKGETEKDAMLGAIGEALERYCSYQENPAAVFLSSSADLGKAAIPPRDGVKVALGPGTWAQLPPPVQESFVRHAPTFLGEMNDPDALTRRYEYYDPIYLLPESGQRWWRDQARAA